MIYTVSQRTIKDMKEITPEMLITSRAIRVYERMVELKIVPMGLSFMIETGRVSVKDLEEFFLEKEETPPTKDQEEFYFVLSIALKVSTEYILNGTEPKALQHGKKALMKYLDILFDDEESINCARWIMKTNDIVLVESTKY